MTAVLFAPHNDDETLFAFYTMVRYQATCVVVLRSMRQEIEQNGPSFQVREAETLVATKIAGVDYIQWRGFYDNQPDWPAISALIRDYITIHRPDVVIAPMWEEGGHEDHNALAGIVMTEFLASRMRMVSGEAEPTLIRYLTYKRGHGRSTDGTEVIPTPGEKAAKRAALHAYASQAEHPPTAPWFGEDQREFVL